jgi:hypothetical protein
MGNHIAQISEASARTRGKAIDKQSDHRFGTAAPKPVGDGRKGRETAPALGQQQLPKNGGLMISKVGAYNTSTIPDCCSQQFCQETNSFA